MARLASFTACLISIPAPARGATEISTALKPHQRDAVRWACRGGCRALFESFGLGKTVQELEWCRLAIRHGTPAQGAWRAALIVLPLGVRGFCYCFQRIERELGGDERIAGALRKARQKVDRKYIRGDVWDDSFAVERMAALERRYQESIEEMQRNHQAEITRLESVIAHQAEQVKEMAVYKARAEAAEGVARALCYDFTDFVCDGDVGNASAYCGNKSAKCVDARGKCVMVSPFCKGFYPEEVRKWTERVIREE